MLHCSAPNGPVGTFKQHIHDFGVPVLVGGQHNAEHWRSFPVCVVRFDDPFAGRSPWIKPNEARVSTYPKLTVVCFEKVGDIAMRQALIGGVVSKRVAVETRQTFGGAEPEEASRVADDRI